MMGAIQQRGAASCALISEEHSPFFPYQVSHDSIAKA
jgi:hypothetical protein